MYSQMEHDVDVEHLEQLRTQLRVFFLAEQAHLTTQPFGDGLKYQAARRYRDEDNLLSKQIAGCTSKLNLSKLNFARRMARREKGEGNSSGNQFRRGRWRPVDADTALRLKQKGQDVRCTGIKTWEVFD